MVGAAALLGLALHGLHVPAAIVAGLLGIAIGAALGYGRPAWRVGAAAAAAIPLVALTPSWPMLAAIAGMLSLAIALGGPRGLRGGIGVIAGAAVVLVAMWAALRVVHAQRTASWPDWATDLAGAAAMAMVGVLALVPRHLHVALDPIAAASRALPRDLDAEVRELCDRAVAIWQGAKHRLDDRDPGRGLVCDGVRKALEVAGKSASLHAAGSDDALTRRMAELDERIAAAGDAEARAQYRAARAALDDQRRYRAQIRASRERLVARLHNHVAALEKFQLAASGLEAARAASAGAPAVQQLEALSHDVAASGEALAELELGVSAT